MNKNNKCCSAVYATNKGGRILSPKDITKDEPRSKKAKGNDLRVKRG